MVKHFYLVRHGETADNHRWIHQSIDVPLNARGRAHAAAAAQQLAARPIDLIVASDAARTQETAAAIAAATGAAVSSEPLLRELRRGVLVEGSHHLSTASLKNGFDLVYYAGTRDWDKDGENVIEFRDRVKAALARLAEAPGERIAVVTHRGVINAVRYCLRHGFGGSPRAFLFGLLLRYTPNGSITELTYDPSRAHPWQLVNR
jgi:broad specificity phosphatase PhoE